MILKKRYMTVIFLVVIIAILTSGVILFASENESYEKITLSRDGKWVSYLVSCKSIIGLGPESIAIRQVVNVCWQPVGKPDNIKTRKVATWGYKQSGYNLVNETHLTFSPDSKCLGVVSPGKIKIIELSNGNMTSKEIDAVIGSFAWKNNDQFAYVTYKDTGEDFSHIRTFWKQNIHKMQESGNIIVQEENVRKFTSGEFNTAVSWPHEYWSPNGIYVIYKSSNYEQATLLLNISNGRVNNIGSLHSSLSIASWSPDSSKAIFTETGKEGKYRTFLLELTNMKIIDISKNINTLVRISGLSYDYFWTPSGDYVVGYDLDYGGYLIHAVTGEIRYVGKIFGNNIKDNRKHELWRQPADNMLIAESGMDEYVIDYKGNVIKHLSNVSSSERWQITPDGKNAVIVDRSGNLIIEKVNFYPDDI